jgi:hypothetical protein
LDQHDCPVGRFAGIQPAGRGAVPPRQRRTDPDVFVTPTQRGELKMKTRCIGMVLTLFFFVEGVECFSVCAGEENYKKHSVHLFKSDLFYTSGAGSAVCVLAGMA